VSATAIAGVVLFIILVDTVCTRPAENRSSVTNAESARYITG
jgi:hypothetical protein